jgi:thiol:disulfide interchange protein DsbD
MKKFLPAILCMICLAPQLRAQGMPNPVKWTFSVNVLNSKEAELVMKAELEPGWHLYAATNSPDVCIPLSLTLTTTQCTADGGLIEPTPVEEMDEVFETLMRYFNGPTLTIRQKLRLNTRSAFELKGELRGQVCKDVCILMEAPFTVQVKP